MNNLSHRQQIILEKLIDENNNIPASKLAEILDVSEKTIYREIQSLREIGYEKIISHSAGKGFKINYQDYIELNLEQKSKTKYIYTREDRREKILLNLLINSPKTISISSLSNQYHISNSSIFNDLKYIESILNGVNLILEKNAKGTTVIGDEKQLREVIKNCVIKIIVQTNEYDLGNVEKINLLFLQEYFSYTDIAFAKDLVIFLRKNEMLIEEPYDMNLLTYIIVSIYRIRQQQFLNGVLDINIIEFHVKKLTAGLKNKIEKYLNMRIPHDEYVNLYQTIISSRYNVNNQELNNSQNESSNFIELLIDQVIEETHFKNFKNSDLEQLLYPHVKYLLRRLKQGISIHNPLIKQIKKEFGVLFNAIKRSLRKLNYAGLIPEVNENETGYLTLYFQHILEIYLQKLRVIIVCSTGIGTSHLLKNRVTHAFPKWEIIDLMNLSQIMKRKDFNKVDLLLTTIKLESKNFPIPVINVSVFFNENDLNNVKRIVNNNIPMSLSFSDNAFNIK